MATSTVRRSDWGWPTVRCQIGWLAAICQNFAGCAMRWTTTAAVAAAAVADHDDDDE
jgi:hypothetical protein